MNSACAFGTSPGRSSAAAVSCLSLRESHSSRVFLRGIERLDLEGGEDGLIHQFQKVMVQQGARPIEKLADRNHRHDKSRLHLAADLAEAANQCPIGLTARNKRLD
jgi:hypothetical protein